MKPIRALLLVWILTAPIFERAAAQELPFTHYTSESEVNPLPSAAVHSMYQDAEGFLWIGPAGAGLVRYDGNAMERYGREDGLVDLQITDLVEDATGRLWASSAAGLVVSEEPLPAYSNGRRIRFTAEYDGIPLYPFYINANCLVADSENGVWVGTDASGVIRYRADHDGSVVADTFSTDGGTGQVRPVYSMLMTRAGRLWVGLGEGVLLSLNADENRLDTLTVGGDRLDETTTTMFERASGEVWGGSYLGHLWKLVEDGGSFTRTIVEEPIGEWIAGIIETPDESLWAVSRGQGLLTLSAAGKRTVFKRQNGLPSDFLTEVLQDREGTIWISHQLGLSKLRQSHAAFQNFTASSHAGEPPVLPAASVQSAVPAGEVSTCIWAATASGVACIRPDGSSVAIGREQGLEGGEAYDLEPDGHGRLWVGISGFSAVIHPADVPVSLIGPTETHRIEIEGEPWKVTTFDLSYVYVVRSMPMRLRTDSDETAEAIWFLSYLKVACYVDGEWFVFRQRSGYPATSSGAVAVDDDGRVWIGTDDLGLYRSTVPVTVEGLREQLDRSLQAEEREPSPSASHAERLVSTSIFEPIWNTEGGAPTNNIQSLLWLDRAMWIGTPEGVFLTDGVSEAAATPGEVTGLPTPNVMAMALSPTTQTLWLGTDEGLVELDPATHSVLRHVTKRAGLIDDEMAFQAGLSISTDGMVYYGTSRGLSVYDPALHRPDPPARTPVVRHVQLTEDPWGNNAFELRFASLSFADEKSVRYRTRLVGYQNAWSDETAEAGVRFTNLHAFALPKRYILEVAARNEQGAWTEEPLRYAFFVQPPLWYRWWAVLGYVALLLAIGFVGYRVQQARLLREMQERNSLREKELRAEAAEAWANYLQAENERQTQELEHARELQLSMLPDRLPDHPSIETAAYMETATEVGGDYYDFDVGEDGTLTFAVGDATGHGARAGTMVTAMKSLFNVFSRDEDLERVLRASSDALRRMRLPQLYMALALGKVKGDVVELVGAGMPPALLYRHAARTVETIHLNGMPLGSAYAYPYAAKRITLERGDMLLLMSDGLPELRGPNGERLGYERMPELFEQTAGLRPQGVVDCLVKRAKDWRQQTAPDDDITLVAIMRK